MAQRMLFWERVLTNVGGGGNEIVIRPDQIPHAREIIVYVNFKAGTTAGVFTLETAHDKDFAGTWSPLTGGTISWAAANSVLHKSVTGLHRALKIRESTPVAGGVADVWVMAN